jgi:hypothetical protein
VASIDSFGARTTLEVGGNSYTIYSLSALPNIDQLPFTHRILLENLLRTEDGANVTAEQIRTLASWDPQEANPREIQRFDCLATQTLDREFGGLLWTAPYFREQSNRYIEWFRGCGKRFCGGTFIVWHRSVILSI